MKPAARREEIARIGRRLRNVDTQLLALDAAIEAFGDRRLADPEWERVFTSTDPDDTNRSLVVMSGYEHSVQNLVELAKAAARVTGLIGSRRPRTEDALVALHEAGAITSRTKNALDDLYAFRGRISHASPDISADEIARYAERALTEIPPMVSSLARWLTDRGIGFRG